jgi:hypothetical protein
MKACMGCKHLKRTVIRIYVDYEWFCSKTGKTIIDPYHGQEGCPLEEVKE